MDRRQNDKIITATNRCLAQWRVAWLIEHSASIQLLGCIDGFVLLNPPMRQASKRYWQPLRFVVGDTVTLKIESEINSQSNGTS